MVMLDSEWPTSDRLRKAEKADLLSAQLATYSDAELRAELRRRKENRKTEKPAHAD